MLQIKSYVKAASLDEAYELNQKKNNVIIGGMHWLKMSTASVGTAIDLSGLGLDKIIETENSFEIGSMVSLRDLELHEGLDTYSNGAVKNAVKDIVGVQFRNTATVGGSIFGRYGFSDVLTVFLAMDSYVVCHKAGEIPLIKYSQMKQDRDIIVKIVVKKTSLKMAYIAHRHARTDFPILTCAVAIRDDKCFIAVGARPYKAMVTVGNPIQDINEENAAGFGKAMAELFTYGTNMRGSAEYRKDIAAVLIKRALLSAERGV